MENATVKDKTYAIGSLILIFFFDSFKSLVDQGGYRNDLVMGDVNVNLVVLNGLDRKNNLVGIFISRMSNSLQRFLSVKVC